MSMTLAELINEKTRLKKLIETSISTRDLAKVEALSIELLKTTIAISEFS